MQVAYHKDYSRHLGRDMEYKRFGHAGRPVVMFPTSRGRFFQYEDTGTIGAMSDFIESGRIQIWTLDGIDGESFFGSDPDLQQRIGRHEAYFRYVREEALPQLLGEAARSTGGKLLKPIMCGCSMGAFHSANFVFRFPQLTAGLIALSGVYSTRDFFGGALDGSIYFNSPLDYLAGLTDEAILGQLRAQRLFVCCGRGAWEQRMIAETHRLEDVLRDKGIPAWIDFWGSDASHDWPWWHRQLAYFMRLWLEQDERQVA